MQSKNHIVLLVAIAIGSLSFGAAAGSSLYRWTDDAGNPVVSDRPPPPGTEFETIRTDSSIVREVNDSEQATSPPPENPAPKKRGQESYKSDKFNTKNPKLCEEARKNLTIIDNAPRIRMYDENGQLKYLSDEERAEQRESNVASVEAFCD